MLDHFLCSDEGVAVVKKAFNVPVIVGFGFSYFDKEGKLELPTMAIYGTEDGSRCDRILNRIAHATCVVTRDNQELKQKNIPVMIFSFCEHNESEDGVVIVTIDALDSTIMLSDKECNGIDDFTNEFTKALNEYVEVKTSSGCLY